MAEEHEEPVEIGEIEFTVPSECDGVRLDSTLRELVDSIPSRSFGAQLIDAGLVTVEGKRVKPSHRLRAGERVHLELSAVHTPGQHPEAENIPLSILFEDADILVINKDAGMVVHPGAGVSSGTLVNAVLAHCGCTLPSLGGPERIGIVHRLDRDTSGVMVVAKSQRALTHLSSQFADHRHERTYFALVQGCPEPAEGRIVTAHGRDPNNRLRFAVLPDGSGKTAALRYKTVEHLCGGAVTLQSCSLETGRTHQIRVQMRHLGCPLLGDKVYGSDASFIKKHATLRPQLAGLLNRQMLHAFSLGIEHPASGCPLRFTAPPPDDFLTLHASLGGSCPFPEF